MSAPPPDTVVVVGAGQAGAGAALALRDAGFGGRIVLIGEETAVPYQRPPLSKAFLKSGVDMDGLHLRHPDVYAQRRIELRLGQRAESIDRERRRVILAGGEAIGYGHLILATGLRHRVLAVPGADLRGVVSLRTIEEAESMRGQLAAARTLVAIGAGFIGLEVAATAAGMGVRTGIVDVAARVLGRAASPVVSAHLAELHGRAGTSLHLGRSVAAIVGEGGRARAVRLDDGTELAADLVVVGIGAVPQTALAEAAGLAVADGIVVDARLRTSDPAISAVGDCARFPCRYAAASADGRVRLESVQNAADQARCVAAGLAGRPQDYAAVPWFWSDQFGIRLQIAGLTAGADDAVVHGEPACGAFSVHLFKADRWLGVESVNRSADHMAARRLLASGRAPTREHLARADFDLKAFAAA
ncbi:FAD-dependent oxidoreductase [Pigmentiphaga soli]|uniref:FAD-dependent oxidoreductase n=1 Tax=Pigmentiphaga soli TaxID=1007095 RepID=A0ABP8H8P0_9BURK